MSLFGSGARAERLVLLGAMALTAALAWAYVWQGAGMGMSALDMTRWSLFPHLQRDTAAGMDTGWLVVSSMWFVMMVAMMTPSAVPLVLLHDRVLRHHGHKMPHRPHLPSLFLLMGYLAVWLGFSVAAAAVQKALEPAGLLSGMMLWSRSAAFSATILAMAGLYQFSPWKQACLSQCQAPARFLSRHWRAGTLGGFLLGLRHGAFCVGCCWLLMALLLVFGVMNLLWIAALTLLVLAEKLLPPRWRVHKVSGGLLLVWAAATMAMPTGANGQVSAPSTSAMPGTASVPAKPAATAIAGFVFGKVVSIEPGDGTLVIDHEDIPNLGMSPMAMEFQVKDRGVLARLKPGDAVRFRATREAGQYVATDLGPR